MAGRLITKSSWLTIIIGYYIRPRDGAHYVKLFADAQFYNRMPYLPRPIFCHPITTKTCECNAVPRLISQLFECEIFIQIGDRHFQIPRDVFSSPGDSPNFFSLGFAVFFASPGDVFPGLERNGLLRPPAITPPIVSNRSGEVFAELLHMLRGYPISIRDEEHRASLLRDCRYFHLRGLEQKLIPYHISYNLERQKSEVVIRLEDIRQSGVSFVPETTSSESVVTSGWVNYARPFVDDKPHELIVEIGGESIHANLSSMRADLHGLAKARVSSLCQVVANKMNLPTNAPLGLLMISGASGNKVASPGRTPLSEDRIKIHLDSSTDINLDGEPYVLGDLTMHNPGNASATLADRNHGGLYAPPRNGNHSHGGGEPRTGDIMMSTPAGSFPQPSSTGDATIFEPGIPPDLPARPTVESPMPPLAPSAVYPRLQTAGGISPGQPSLKRRKQDSIDKSQEWVISKGQWRLRVQPNPTTSDPNIGVRMEIVFVAVKVEAFTKQRSRNSKRPFLD